MKFVTYLVMVFFASSLLATEFTTINTPLPLKKEPEKIQSSIHKSELHELYQRILRRKQLFEPAKDDYEQLFELLTDPELIYQNIELSYLVGLAIDQRILTEQFTNLGYQRKSDKSYIFNSKQNLHLISVWSLFSEVHTTSQWACATIKNDLINRGFRQQDIKILKQHIKLNNPHDKVRKLNTDYLNRQIHAKLQQLAISQNKSDHDKMIDFMITYTYINKYHYNLAWYNWGKTLLNKLDPQRQRIIKSYMLERLDENISITGMTRDDYRIGFEQIFKPHIIKGKIPSHSKTKNVEAQNL